VVPFRVAELVALGRGTKAGMPERKSASTKPSPAPYDIPPFLNSWRLGDDSLKQGGIGYSREYIESLMDMGSNSHRKIN
jgi:hypothetical protein